MELLDRFTVVDAQPAVHVPALEAVAIADLHLGLEALMADAGMFMPKVQLEEVTDGLSTVFDAVDADTLIVCGDIKHEFSEQTQGELEEVQRFLDYALRHVDEVVITKGNHDNYLERATGTFDRVTVQDYLVRDGIAFLHGHERPDDPAVTEADCLVIGHEHPALALTDDIGVEETVACFLAGTLDDGRDILVLPAFSSFSTGARMNRLRQEDRMSPYLQDQDIGGFRAIGIDSDAGLLPFPALEKLPSGR